MSVPEKTVHAGMGSDLMALCGKVEGVVSGVDQVTLSYVSDQVTCQDCLRMKLAAAERELERLKKDYPGGDTEAQAMSWSAVYRACEKVGLLSFLGSRIRQSSRDRVIEFIEHLAGVRNQQIQRLGS